MGIFGKLFGRKGAGSRPPMRGNGRRVDLPESTGLCTHCLFCGGEVYFSPEAVQAVQAAGQRSGLRVHVKGAEARCCCGRTGRLRFGDNGEMVVDW